MTLVGTVLGTAAYMSPEQARGKAVDQRTDIWSLGVILFEMLSGERLFAGETISDILAGVLRAELDFAQVPKGLPANVDRVLRRSLVRDRRQRLRSAGDVWLELMAEESAQQAGNVTAPPSRFLYTGGCWPHRGRDHFVFCFTVRTNGRTRTPNLSFNSPT